MLKKIDNEVKNIFLYDTGNSLKKFSSSVKNIDSTTILAEKGIVKKKSLFLINGQIISTKFNGNENKIINFDQLNIDLNKLKTTVIKALKLQETSTLELLTCFDSSIKDSRICNKESKKRNNTHSYETFGFTYLFTDYCFDLFIINFKNRNFFSNRISVFFIVLCF